MSTLECQNCNRVFDGNFCPYCGQSSATHRVNASYFLHDIPHSVFHVDKGFPYTFIQLIKRPAGALKEYLAGRRVKYFRPLGYVLIMSAICALIVSRIQIYLKGLQQDSVQLPQNSFLSQYPAIFIFLMIPLAGCITWLVFRKRHYNFWEHLLINTYMAAQLNVLLVLISFFSLIKYQITGSASYTLWIFMFGFMFYYAFTFNGLLNTERKGFSFGVKLGIMCFLLASVYVTGMILAGITKG